MNKTQLIDVIADKADLFPKHKLNWLWNPPWLLLLSLLKKVMQYNWLASVLLK